MQQMIKEGDEEPQHPRLHRAFPEVNGSAMFLNHIGMNVYAWDKIEPSDRPRSRCPECMEELLARRGAERIWHWAHRPGTDNLRSCSGEETEWHLRWKAAHLNLGWAIEVPVLVGEKRFRVDAMHLPKTNIREFVHSLSPTYIEKHQTLKLTGASILWIFDGDTFTWNGRKEVSGKLSSKGYRHLLSPKARDLHREIGGLVHFERRLWEHWKADIWYPARDGALELAIRYRITDLELVFANAKPAGPREPVVLQERQTLEVGR